MRRRTVVAGAGLALLMAGSALPPAAGEAAGAVRARPVTAHFCWGAENSRPAWERRVRPTGIVLECEAYSPQHGYTNTAWLTGITWTRFGGRTAEGDGYLQKLWCPDGGDLVGTTVCTAAQATIPAHIRLSGVVRDGDSGRLRYRSVSVDVDALPDAPGPLTLTWQPPPDAYQ